ncbi:hypothetical protein Tco_1202470 [Tanacetum coccineum]
MAFFSAVFSSCYPSTNNQLRSSSNLKNQATVQDGRMLSVQEVQGRKGQNVVGSGSQGNASGEGHMARECTQPKRRRDATWFKEKVLLVQAQSEGKELDEKQFAFLADPGVADNQVAQTITHNELQYFEQTPIVDYPDNEITSDSNIIPYSQYLEETQHAYNESKIVNESLTAELERYKERVKILEQRFNVDLSSREKFIDSQMDDMIRIKNTKFAAFETEIDTLKQTLSKHVKEKESLLTTLNGFKTEFKERESKSIDKEIVLENKNKELENIVCKLYQSTQAMYMLAKPNFFYDNTHKQAIGYQNPFYLKRAQWIKPILYDGNVLSKTHDVLYMVDEEENLILAEESQLKIVEKQNDPIMKKEKININPINYSELNKLAEDFGKRFVPQQELSTEQMFWLQSSNKNSEEPSTSNTPVEIEVPSELPKFDKGLHDEITEIQSVLTQMEAVVEQCSVNRKCCDLQKKQFLIENDRLLDKIISQEIVNIVLNSSVIICDSEKENVDSVDTCNKCLELEDELVKKNNVYLELSKWFSNLLCFEMVFKPSNKTIAFS